MAANDPDPEIMRLNSAMKNVFISKDGADVTFIIHGTELQAHKNILTAGSPVFKAMIEGPMAPADQRHLIDDPEITYEDFENFVRFFYTDKLEERYNFKALLHLGNFYDVPYLLQACVRYIEESLLHPSNVLEFAEMGLLYAPTSSLLEVCLNLFYDFFRDGESLSYCPSGETFYRQSISPELTLEIVKQHKILTHGVSQDTLFKKAFEWSKNECIRQIQEITPKNIQRAMAPLMPYFDPRHLLPSTLLTIIKTFKLIPDNQLIESLADHMTKVINEDCRLDVSHSGYSRHNHSRGYGARRDYDDENYPRLGYRGYANQVSTRGRYGGGGYGQRSSDAW